MSLITAREFSASLHMALAIYPEHAGLHEMARGELNTTNLVYGEYQKRDDHFRFLDHFFTSKLSDLPGELLIAADAYKTEMRQFSPEERAMTVISRERELPGIFTAILASHNWEEKSCGYYKYYLERHIELDSQEAGHADLTKDIKLDPKVLTRFYAIRLRFYKSALVG